MKKNAITQHIIALFCASLFSNYSVAQYLANGNFSVNCGTNTIGGALSSCRGFSSSCIYNWGRSHGRSTLILSPATALRIRAANGLGQGIYTNYPFCPGYTYKISFRLEWWRWYSLPTPENKLRLFATNGLTTNDISPSCMEPLPSTAGSQNILDLSGSNFHTYWSGGVVTVYYTNTSGTPFAQLWILHENPNAELSSELMSSPDRYGAGINKVCIERVCEGDDLIIANSVAAAVYDSHDRIFAGSSFGGSGTVTIAANTEFKAASAILMKDNFEAAPSPNGGYFLAELTDCTTPRLCGYNGPLSQEKNNCPTYGGRITMTQQNTENNTSLEVFEVNEEESKPAGIPAKTTVENENTFVTLSPNPVINELNINYSFPQADAMNITIFDMNGRALYTEQKTCTRAGGTHKINIANFSSGLYLVKIKSTNHTTILKVTKL